MRYQDWELARDGYASAHELNPMDGAIAAKLGVAYSRYIPQTADWLFINMHQP